MKGLVCLAGPVDTCSHRQTPSQTPMDIRVNSDHMPFTPFPPLVKRCGWGPDAS